ncbi:MAG: nucleotidyltransferase, partial [Pseudomonadota bacterium]
GNVRALARIARAWKAQWDVPIGGLLIDTLVYYFMRDYEHQNKGFIYYDWMSRDFFNYLRTRDQNQNYWLSPGANQYVWRKGNFEYKATRCYNIAVDACSYQGDKYGWTAHQKWREIYGSDFPTA